MKRFCVNCGKELSEGSDICLNCGKMVNSNSQNVQPAQPIVKTNGLAIAGFVVSLSSLLINLFGIVGAVGTILSSIGLAKLKKNNEKGFGLALTGIIVGAFSIIYGIYQTILFFSALATWSFWL